MATAFRVLALMVASLLAALSSPAWCQQAEPAKPAAGGFRKLAPGIERTIAPQNQEEERFSRQDLVGLLRKDAKFGERAWAPRNLAKEVRLDHAVWGLEFTFKPVRYLEAEIPDGNGRLERKLVWYLCYHVKNNGDKPVRFVPRFVLYAHDPDKYYDDRVMPLVVSQIQRREDPKRKLQTSVSISEVDIPPSPEGEDNSVWGVATWRDIDPRTDRFSIFVQGLTSSYRIEEVKGDDETVPGVWRFTRKTLQLNFWRPGDEYYEHEGEIRLGIPGDVDYRWVYK